MHQLISLYYLSEKQLAKEKEFEYKFYAMLHGFDLDKEKTDNKGKDKTERKLTKEELFEEAKKSSVPVFRDPSYYDHLTQEEKEELTNIMMGKHKVWRDQQVSSHSMGGS